MTSDDGERDTSREDTDLSLRVERQKTDKELAEKRASVENEADAVVQRARERADRVLSSARDWADARLQGDASVETREALGEERVREDEALDQERATEDMNLKGERDEAQRALAALLHLEREATDRNLRIERARSDESVAKRDDFLGMVSHDLRTMLGGIAMNAALLKRLAIEDDAARKTIQAAESIERFTARMNRLIGDLLNVVSIQAGTLSVLPERGDAARLLREAVEAFHPIASAKGIALDADVVKGSLPAKFDHDRMLQVLANLLGNAIKFTGTGGRVSIQVEPAGEEVLFSVADTGVGIPVDMVERIFERFWQADKMDRRGLGLGLFISKCIVEGHGGRMWVKSEPGAGSTFYFTLPGALSGDASSAGSNRASRP